ncbi:MAG: Asp-tRNA(Asn)/Glu-tRNA(Gln) amidotransferase subunit GatC [Candidatus Colwellbacteria bacterium]|nr:Asp-tRNA(Asn)/Glu-tRNA(Gln) amidotransferase subunit GatC [Candidatus Colwellbacteria bacterium]
MAQKITRDDIKRLSALARIDIGEKEETILKDATEIIGHFEELNQIDTGDVDPMTGATSFANQVDYDKKDDALIRKGISSFPETEDGLLVVPKIMTSERENG